jgi:hypothetical protein
MRGSGTGTDVRLPLAASANFRSFCCCLKILSTETVRQGFSEMGELGDAPL